MPQDPHASSDSTPDPATHTGLSRRQFVHLTVAGATAVGAGAVASWWAGRDGKPERGPGDQYIGQIERAAATDASTLRYQPGTILATGISHARDIAVSASGIAVAAAGRLVLMDAQGHRLAETDLSQSTRAVAWLPDGSLLVGCGAEVIHCSAKGDVRGTWFALPDRAIITSIAVTSTALYLADASHRCLWKCEGDFAHSAEPTNKATRFADGLRVPSPYLEAIADEQSGLTWVTNPGRHRLEAYDGSGQLVKTWGDAGGRAGAFCGCCNPSHVAMTADGGFVTSEKGLNRVSLFDPHGRFVGLVAGHEALDAPIGRMDCDSTLEGNAPPIAAPWSDGRILVLHPRNGRLQAFAPLHTAGDADTSEQGA